MPYKFEEGKAEIIDDLISLISKNIEDKQKDLCARFASRFLSTVALSDLEEWETEDLYGAVINYWGLLYQRAPSETKIRIYNPDYERHGWQTTHTVIEIVHDDMPFLVDSIRMEINRMGLTSHLIIHMGDLPVYRDKDSKIVAFGEKDGLKKEKEECSKSVEAAIVVEINRITDPVLLNSLHENLARVLKDNRAVVQDWRAMQEKVVNAITEIDLCKAFVDSNELTESKAFLSWLVDHHFTFLGVRDYELVTQGKETILRAMPRTGLGVLRESLSEGSCRSISAMTPEARALTLSTQILVISKTNTRSTVHRPVYTDYIGIKRFDKKGQVIGERRIIGLYTSAAYNTNPKHIPFLRHKVTRVMGMSGVNPKSHAGKVIQNILDTLPRDDLFQASEEELLEMAMGIFHMQERRKIRLFARKDIYGRFISCLVYVPKELFNTELRQEIQKVICDSVGAVESTFSTRFSDSILARIHFIIKLNPKVKLDYSFEEIETKIIEIARSWEDDLREHLLEAFGEEESNRLFQRYGRAFSSAYRETFHSRTAVYDIKHLEELSDKTPLGMSFYRPVGEISGHLRFKIYQYNQPIPLSDVLPILENLGLRIISERSYVLKLEKNHEAWINDFSMFYQDDDNLNVDKIKERFQEAFLQIWFQKAENDGFNHLVLGASLDWQEVRVLRAYAKYFKQIQFTFSQEYIESALSKNPKISQKLVAYFKVRLSPFEGEPERTEKAITLREEIFEALDKVDSLDEDKIIRRYLEAITATLRTNFFQCIKGKAKDYLSFKFNPKEISDMPLPHPAYEIFVYSARFEGVHLRCGKVARGGLRWSDRREDFRTEILGLMKAQQVKNSVIVPNGAKGGFVPKRLPMDGSREDIMAEGIYCYKDFIRGLLDITDNYVTGKVIKPKNVYCFDDDDPYLVVAADKGTATFSDIANEISQEYDFWLGDAFASGGSSGYDHKKMGITAKGAWESVKRHFREIGVDIQTSDFTVVGVGDMAGDVFGNGMLLSKHIKLLAAFNHLHIFIDPTPDPFISYEERKRLFHLPRSSWKDYNPKLISKGGGVFDRKAKSIKLSPEIKQAFNIEQTVIEPNDLIKCLLRAKVDLLWSAGIGTFVKASKESHADVGDRTNDPIRVNAKELHCKVVGEGGNLGLTQLARVEYSLHGGMIYTDFIDNSAGVDCSDNEVNIKILLNSIVKNGDLTLKQRNSLLAEMTDEVSSLVLRNNYQQTQAISLANAQALRNVELHARFIDELERAGKLDRSLEFIPEQKVLIERKLKGKGLGRPVIAVLLCYSKILLHEQILSSNVPEDPFLVNILVEAFPKPLREKFKQEILSHQLKREIIATKLSNIVVNEMGFAFIYRLQDETGASPEAIVKAYMIARTIFNQPDYWRGIQSLDNKVDNGVQIEMMMQIIRVLRRATRWLLRSKRLSLDITTCVKLYLPGIKSFNKSIGPILERHHSENYLDYLSTKKEQGVPQNLAEAMGNAKALFSSLDIIDAAYELEVPINEVSEVYFSIGNYLDLNWVRTQVIVHPIENHWEALSREALRDDLDWQQKELAIAILKTERAPKKAIEDYTKAWSKRHDDLIQRWRRMLADLQAQNTLNFTMYLVAIRELLDLTQTTIQSSNK